MKRRIRWETLSPEQRLATAREIRERVYQKWLRGDAFTPHLKAWDAEVARLAAAVPAEVPHD